MEDDQSSDTSSLEILELLKEKTEDNQDNISPEIYGDQNINIDGFRNYDGDVADLQEQVISILNTMPHQDVGTLVDKFEVLPINSYNELSIFAELVFEKAVIASTFKLCAKYAQLCKLLKMKQAPVKGVNKEERGIFRKCLISRCQKEFEMDDMDSLNFDKYKADVAAATTKKDIKIMKEEFEIKERKMRLRSLGLISFVGELYNVGLLTARIIHECIKKLLKLCDEESLEYICRLLTIGGKDFDEETKVRVKKDDEGIVDLTVYFKIIVKSVNEKSISSRVRSLTQDVIDLKNNGWKKKKMGTQGIKSSGEMSDLVAKLEETRKEVGKIEKELTFMCEIKGQKLKINEQVLDDASKRAEKLEDEFNRLLGFNEQLCAKLNKVEVENKELKQQLSVGGMQNPVIVDFDKLQFRVSELEKEQSKIRTDQHLNSKEASSLPQSWTGIGMCDTAESQNYIPPSKCVIPTKDMSTTPNQLVSEKSEPQ